MRIWLQVRRAATVALVVLIVAVLLLPAGTHRLPLPGFGGGSDFGIPLALFAPVAVAIAVAAGLAAGEPRLEAVAARPLPFLDAMYAVVVASTACGIFTLVWVVTGNALVVFALEAGRNVLGYVGLSLAARPVIGPLAAGLPPVAVAIGAALIGFHADGSARWWAWPVAEARNELSWVLAILLLIGGAVAAVALPTAARD